MEDVPEWAVTLSATSARCGSIVADRPEAHGGL
jgi:hypothetical protein